MAQATAAPTLAPEESSCCLPFLRLFGKKSETPNKDDSATDDKSTEDANLQASSVQPAVTPTTTDTDSELPQSNLEQQDANALYRKVIGPLRMEFLTGAFEQHAHATTPACLSAKKRLLYKELACFSKNLPVDPASSIVVRASESRLDLIRAMITGPEGTPYENGCFFFDICARDYPEKPPQVRFLTTGNGSVRFNPNLYVDGKVCLSILGTWSGPGWQPGKSTLLQVLVSLQGLVFVPYPYFNEPGRQPKKGEDIEQHSESASYNRNTRISTLRHATLPFLRAALGRTGLAPTYPEFEEVVRLHFLHRASAIEEQLDKWSRDDESTELAELAAKVRELLRRLAAQ